MGSINGSARQCKKVTCEIILDFMEDGSMSIYLFIVFSVVTRSVEYVDTVCSRVR